MFYSKFIIIESVIAELDTLDLSKSEKNHLSVLLDSALHHSILDQILSHLGKDDKRVFLQLLLHQGKDEEILDFLSKRIENIDDKIKQAADDLVKQMHKEVKEAKRIKKKE